MLFQEIKKDFAGFLFPENRDTSQDFIFCVYKFSDSFDKSPVVLFAK